jgi:hypothetical protein
VLRCCVRRFRWVELQLETFFGPKVSLLHAKDVSAKLDKLEGFSTTLEPNKMLDNVYDEIYELNTEPGSFSRACAEKALKWVMCSQRQLKSHELVQAVKIRAFTEPDSGVNEKFLLTACRNLLVFTEAGVVQFAHLSVTEYLERRESDGERIYSVTQANAQAAEGYLA